ncbi:MAG: hypothetical protein A2X48_15940 [Lentisphaerae bacterium GWF2_49_21]|nr:MAG: hypothetical protein A2X48_15940 [Lentisphaerae bacterium GWF2_49_21]
MIEINDVMKTVFPGEVLSEISGAIPEECRKNMIIIGSLAVGYHFLAGKEGMAVRTKDADCLLSPRIRAVPAGEAIAEKLFTSGWTIKKDGEWNKPGDENTLPSQLPAIRLNPPGNTDWFIELLTVPESSEVREKKWLPFKTSQGYFGLPSFGFLSLTNFEPMETEMGIHVARPEMMALANMLEHPRIKPDLMSGYIEGRRIKRSNKDLGRVLAIAFLSTGEDVDSLEKWPDLFRKAMESCFPAEWQSLVKNTGSGLRELLTSDLDMDEAHHTCRYGLLASQPPTLEQLKIAGKRLLQDAVEPLEKMGSNET